MTNQSDQRAIHYHADKDQISCTNDWDITHYAEIQSEINHLKLPSKKTITLDGQSIKKIDSSGALLLVHLQNKLKSHDNAVHLQGFSKQAQQLLEIVEHNVTEKKPVPRIARPKLLAKIGRQTVLRLGELDYYLSFLGHLTYETFRLLKYPGRWRLNSLIAVIYSTGFQALPIIALLSFLIGVVLAYQMGLQLKDYGANIYIVDLLGLSVLREFAPLITAIMVSGRTGSAYTATLGMMKLNQEIDALNTMGVTPAELLLLPRILGLLIVLPLLTMWSNIFALLGGMAMANNLLDITWRDFLLRFPQVVPLKTLIIGLGKTPVFALIIGTIGCFEGMRVKHSAESVGRNTTKSVVLAIFYIIVADAAFSVILSKMKL